MPSSSKDEPSEQWYDVYCICGNSWKELLRFPKPLAKECTCPFPGDDEEAPDDSVTRGQDHVYGVDLLSRPSPRR